MLKKVPFIFKSKKTISHATFNLSSLKFGRANFNQRGPIPLFVPKEHSLTFNRHSSNLNSQVMDFAQEKVKYLNMSLDEKRALYSVKSNYVTLKDIKPWSIYASKFKPDQSSSAYPKKPHLNEKVSIYVGDITALEVDAIVNAANKFLKGGGGVDGAIHRAAGSFLLAECSSLNGCDTGNAKITGGYKLPAKYVIHTVGPIGENEEALGSCYKKSLNLALENNIKSVAFPCISTGIYGYPNEKAAHVAIRTVREVIEQNDSSFERIIFCLFLPVDVGIYEALMQEYFPF